LGPLTPTCAQAHGIPASATVNNTEDQFRFDAFTNCGRLLEGKTETSLKASKTEIQEAA
jgi:hypothetical protein